MSKYLAGPGDTGMRNNFTTVPEFGVPESRAIGIKDAVPFALDLEAAAISGIGRKEARQHSPWLHPNSATMDSIAVLQSASAACIAVLAA